MTNIQAINLLKGLEQSLDDYYGLNDKGKTAFRMAIEALNCSEIPNGSGKDTNVPSNDTISRQAAIDAFGLSEKTRKYGGDHSGYDTRMLYEIQDILEGLPSAQPELIRCKDCKYSEHWYKDKTRCFLWHETGIDVFEDGYCNYAKRRADADMRGEQDG